MRRRKADYKKLKLKTHKRFSSWKDKPREESGGTGRHLPQREPPRVRDYPRVYPPMESLPWLSQSIRGEYRKKMRGED